MLVTPLLVIPLLAVAAAFPSSCAAPADAAVASASAPEIRNVKIPGSTVTIELARLPGDAGLWMSTTEITWDAYDTFVYGLAEPERAPGEPDAYSRPSHPYTTADRGFGHAGYPALSMSLAGAQAFCVWLSGLTGERFRLPTQAEWERACRAGRRGALASAELDELAWHRANAERKTHPVGSKRPNAWGLFDMLGNAAEWCFDPHGPDDMGDTGDTNDTGRTNGPGGTAALRGGSFRDRPEEVGASAVKLPSPAWNASDPQLPKSSWWLADAPFAGFRVLREDD